jgi:hypothetical protein
VIGAIKVEKIINQLEVNNFLSQIEGNFPNFVAGVVCDNDGFMIGAKVPKNFHIHENALALSAISGNRDFINDPRLMKVKRDLSSKENIKLFVLLEKSNRYINRFKELNEIIDQQNLF